MPKKTKKKTAAMLKKRRGSSKTKKKVRPDSPASPGAPPSDAPTASPSAPSAITKIGNKLKNVAITTANEIIPEVPTEEVKVASRELGTKAGATAAAAGTAAATIGTAVITKVKDDPAFRAAAINLGYTVLGTTQDGLLFLVNNNRLIRRPAMKIIKRGLKLAFIPAKTLGMLILQAALTAASVVPPLAVAIKLFSAGSKLGWQVVRGQILMYKLATSNAKLANNILELILRFTNVIPIMTRNFKKIGSQTRSLMSAMTSSFPPLPPIPGIMMTDTLKVFKPTQRKIERRLARIPNPMTKISKRLPAAAIDALVPEGLGDVKLKQLPNKISKMGEKVQKQVTAKAEKAGKQITAAIPTAVATPVTSPAPKGTPTATATPIKGGRRKRRTRKKRRRQRRRKYRTRRRRWKR